MKLRIALAGALFGLVVAGAPAYAHHSVSAQFDYDKPFDMQATLERVEWISPHSYLHFVVNDGGGKSTEWAIESFGVGGLRNKGLTKDVLKVGDTYKIRGFKARNGKPNGFLREIEFSNGKIFRVWSGDPNGK